MNWALLLWKVRNCVEINLNQNTARNNYIHFYERLENHSFGIFSVVGPVLRPMLSLQQQIQHWTLSSLEILLSVALPSLYFYKMSISCWTGVLREIWYLDRPRTNYLVTRAPGYDSVLTTFSCLVNCNCWFRKSDKLSQIMDISKCQRDLKDYLRILSDNLFRHFQYPPPHSVLNVP